MSTRPTIEDVILTGDRRGVSALRRLLPPAYTMDAARLLLAAPDPVVVMTGFVVASSGTAETDGPPGAGALAEALVGLGRRVILLTDDPCEPVVAAAAPGVALRTMPVGPGRAAQAAARRAFEDLAPGVVVAIERLGPSADGVHRSFRGEDLTATVSPIATLIGAHPCTIGVGDGGNEIGMGLVAGGMGADPRLPALPCVTRTTALVLAAVSNWGAYGLVAAASCLVGRDLLPGDAAEAARLDRCVAAGAVDGVTGRREPFVDGFPFSVTAARLAALRSIVAAHFLDAPGGPG